MTLYAKSLIKYAYIYKAVEDWAVNTVFYLKLDYLLNGLRKAKEAAMLSHVEILTQNINKCTEYRQLNACRGYYEIVCISHPDFRPLFGKIILDMIERKEKLIVNSNKIEK